VKRKKPPLSSKDLNAMFGSYRDIDKDPYNESEARVAEWLYNVAGVGGGDDPVGFMISSYEFMVAERKEMKQQIAALQLDNERLNQLSSFDTRKNIKVGELSEETVEALRNAKAPDPGEDLYQATRTFIDAQKVIEMDETAENLQKVDEAFSALKAMKSAKKKAGL
jgi:hypothetical protein